MQILRNQSTEETRGECKIVNAWTGEESREIYFSAESARKKIRETDRVNKFFRHKELLIIVPEHAVFDFNDRLGITGKSPTGKYWSLGADVFTISENNL